jgi:hypothetical protein
VVKTFLLTQPDSDVSTLLLKRTFLIKFGAVLTFLRSVSEKTKIPDALAQAAMAITLLRTGE